MHFKITKIELTFMIDVLSLFELTSTQNRIRTRFKKLIEKYHKESELERKQLIDEHALFNGDGSYKFIEGSNGIVDFGSDEISFKVMEAVNDLHSEFIYIECNEENKKMLTTIADLMLSDNISLRSPHSDFHAEWCDQFESILDFYKNKEGE